MLFAHFQMLRDTPKARREVELHCRASSCPRIVEIEDVFENYYQRKKCLLLIMEWYGLLTHLNQIVINWYYNRPDKSAFKFYMSLKQYGGGRTFSPHSRTWWSSFHWKRYRSSHQAHTLIQLHWWENSEHIPVINSLFFGFSFFSPDSTKWVEASETMRSIGEAVEFLHGINIAHRDLKVSYCTAIIMHQQTELYYSVQKGAFIF